MFSKYRELGLSLIPIRNEKGQKGKAPIPLEWQQWCTRLPTEAECEEWESQGHKRYGVCCGPASNVMGVDIDTDDIKVINACKPSPVSKRGAKGETRFFKYNPEIPTGKVGGIIDILALGRQSIVPPTIHPDTGIAYQWITPDTLENFSVSDLPEFTVADLQALRQATEGEYREDVEGSGAELTGGPWFNTDPTRGCPHGSQDRLKRIVNAMIARGASADEAAKELIRYDEENHKPTPYFSDPTRADFHADPVTNAILFYASNLKTFNKRATREGGSVVPMIPGSEILSIEIGEVEDRQWKPMKWPEPRGTLKDIRDIIMKHSEREIPALAMGGAITLASVAIGNKLKLGDNWPNTQGLNVAETGAGKSFPYTAIKRILSPENGLDHLLGLGGYKSGTGIIKDLVKDRVRLDTVDECSQLFEMIRKGGVFQTEVMDILNDLWTQSASHFTGPGFAEKDTVKAWHPCVSVLMSTNPAGIRNTITKEFVMKGFLPRTLIFNEIGYGKFNESPHWDTELEKKIVAHFTMLQELAAGEPIGPKNLLSDKPCPMDIGVTPAALRLLRDYSRQNSEALQTASEMERSFLSRRGQHAQKIALVQGAMDSMCVDVREVEWAFRLLDVIRHNTDPLLPHMSAENEQETSVMRVFSLIKNAPSGRISHQELYRKTQFLKSQARNEILATLEASGQIQSGIDNTKTKPAKWYMVSK